MQAYRVTGIGFGVGAGALLIVSASQAADRAHKLDAVDKPKKDMAFVLVKAKETQQFKVGELLGLSDLPKGQMHMVEAIEAKRKGDPETSLVKACADFHAAAEEAELAQQLAAEEAETKRRKELAAAEEQARIADWTAEYQGNDAIRVKYPKLDDYLAARRAEKPAA